jgi:2-succinyl-5-enolpyruvyl-6-hydroxy-3-cyclohexene-1-carboxylate synthase
VVVASPEAVCRSVASTVPVRRGGDWARRWSGAEEAAQVAIERALAAEEGLTEPGVARSLLLAAPAGASIVVSSSMPVRDLEWWSLPRAEVRVLANRGANGIDGALSTAMGVAAAGSRGGVIAVLGDLAFLYDAGALLVGGRGGARPDLDVVVVDNDGGGIFSFLPQAGSQPPERFERMWGTPQDVDLVALARAYGAEVEEIPDLARLAEVVAAGRTGRGVRALIAKTDRVANVAVHRRLHAAVEAAIEAGVEG